MSYEIRELISIITYEYIKDNYGIKNFITHKL